LLIFLAFLCKEQPPSGGCVLKPSDTVVKTSKIAAATFGWLCVETTALTAYSKMCQQPPSGGCVLKLLNHRKQVKSDGAATFGWLCVETLLVLI